MSKVGRPKKEQTKPLIFEHARSRVTRPVTMSAKTAADLSRYVAWAAATATADEQDAMTLTMDQALGQFFQRDKLFKESGDDDTETTGAENVNIKKSAPPHSTSVASKTSATTTPTLPRPGVAS